MLVQTVGNVLSIALDQSVHVHHEVQPLEHVEFNAHGAGTVVESYNDFGVLAA